MAEYLEVIEYFFEDETEMVHRIPESGSGETKFGAQLVVRENQTAVFFRDGKGLDVFGPGRHTLSTMNLPILTKFLSLPFGFKSPFRCEVLFINMKVFTDLKWGTRNPVAFRDEEFGLVRLRAYGNYTMRITQPLLFINTLVGTKGIMATEDISGYLRDVTVSRLNDLLGEHMKSILDLPQNYEELAVVAKVRLKEDFQKYGIELIDFFINEITPPDEVQRIIDERTGMGVVGDMNQFLKYEAAKAMGSLGTGAGAPGAEGAPGPAGAPGTVASGAAAGMGVGVGAGLGMMVPGMLFKTMLEGDITPEKIKKQGFVNCPKCHTEVPINARFCTNCGSQLVVVNKCTHCGKNLHQEDKFCSVCGKEVGEEIKCKNCGAKLPDGAQFCTECGEKVE
jgi:membrane protease subunit (stomatin/prohibitin family)